MAQTKNPPAKVTPGEFVTWCKSKKIDVAWLREVEQTPLAGGTEAKSTDDAIPGKMPRTAIGKLAVKAAWEIECVTGKRAIATQVIKKLQEWEKDEPILTETIPHGVKWVTSKGIEKSFDIQTCTKALETWSAIRA